MATQLADQPGGDDAPRDYEADARKMGWSGPESFKGDPDKFIDAETFVRRGEEMLPVLKAQNAALLRKFEKVERDAKRAAEYFEKAEQRAYERAKADIRAEMSAAVESGDAKAHDAAVAKLEKLEKPSVATEPVSGGVSPEEAQEALIDWRRENKWFGSNSLMTDYAELQADKMLKAGMMPGPEHLAAILEKVKAKFPEEFEEGGEEAPKPRRRPAVEGGNTIPPRARSGGKTYDDLPADAKATCDRWVKTGIIPNREAYVKSYDFGA